VFRIALSYISCDSLFIIVIVLCDSNLTIFYDSIIVAVYASRY